ncbi:hypothetical protein OJAV_G00110060 [Oryzias javanicus]|uniref:Uncharacterized protein n=1 Tax=Oryzias javanicus TaxID=123683 RepID=A0A3S2Q0X0_ORYJA|nr:hypothetical protein OJAV_G00110060 [Oryzias javanicus]
MLQESEEKWAVFDCGGLFVPAAATQPPDTAALKLQAVTVFSEPRRSRLKVQMDAVQMIVLDLCRSCLLPKVQTTRSSSQKPLMVRGSWCKGFKFQMLTSA